MWDEKNRCLSWKDTLEYASVLGLKFVKPIYVGKYDRKLIEKSFEEYIKRHEGYVIRLADGFNYRDFRTSVGKYVRKDHVQSTHHWRREIKELNNLEI